jgi:ribosomal protein L29
MQCNELARLVAEQKDLLLAILAHSLAAVRDEVIEHLEQKIAELSAELGQLRADVTIAKAHDNKVLDLRRCRCGNAPE